ncbi:MAG: hypothetical protein IPK16_12150 [Anaerolineales bacterium]|nr:hypothetical protein [Anaerolineales bacterium]
MQPLSDVSQAELPDWKATWESREDEWQDSLAVRYRARAADAIAADDQRNATLWLDAALSLHPGDLYANYYRRQFNDAGQDAENDPYLQRLQQFTEAGLLPLPQQLAEYTLAVAPKLVADGIWTPEQLVRAARVWVWQYPESPALAAMLDAQCSTQSAGDQWCQLAAERTARIRAGEASAQESPPSLEPLLAKLGIQDAVVGSSTFKHGAIETWSKPEVDAEWKWSNMVNAPNFNAALFLGGVDPWQPFAGENAVRVDGLWQTPDTGANPARAGFWSVPTQTLPAGSAWLLSFAYRTSGDEPSSSVWLSGQPSAIPPELYLLSTAGEWRQEGSCW